MIKKIPEMNIDFKCYSFGKIVKHVKKYCIAK